MLKEYKTGPERTKAMNNMDPVWKWMTSNPHSIRPNQTLLEAGEKLRENGIDGLPVTDEEGKVVGLITKTKLVDCFLNGISPAEPVSAFMTAPVITIEETQSVRNAYVIKAGRLPVTEADGRLCGMLTRTDILQSYASYLERIQETLHTAETLAIILESAYEGVVVVDSNGIIREVNEAYLRFLGKTRDETIGKHVATIIENTRLHLTIQSGIAERGHIQHIQGQDMVVHRIPIWKEGKVIGAIGMLIFQGVSELYNILGRMQELTRQVKQKAAVQHRAGKEPLDFDAIIGKSAEIHRVKRLAMKAAGTPSTVLITGESGTGKEIFANAIHNLSQYAAGPFISVNCAAIPEHLLEAELFGYEEGAFTGAKKGGKPGKFELADKGTLFLDEIGDMPPFMQSKILRVLQERKVERVGGIEKRPVDVRIISATNRRLEEMVKTGEFREDLYYRLNIIRLEIPPLRERKEDILLLLSHHLQDCCSRFGIGQKRFSPGAVALLAAYDWPGNVRELVNMVEMMVGLSESDTIEAADLPEYVVGGLTVRRIPERTQATAYHENPLMQVKDLVLEREKQLILHTLAETNGNKAEAARRLGIQRSTLYEKLKKHELTGAKKHN